MEGSIISRLNAAERFVLQHHGFTSPTKHKGEQKCYSMQIQSSGNINNDELFSYNQERARVE